jgi:hypothetical protein
MPDLNTSDYKTRRTWSDSHLEQVKAALGKKFFKESSFIADTKFGIDLCVPELEFAVRIRQLKYKNYTDFTMRSSGGGDRSEYAKLLDVGAPDFLFYGYALDKNTLAAGYLIDLRLWKLALVLKEIKPQFRRNKDGSHFVVFPFYNIKRKPYTELFSYCEQII